MENVPTIILLMSKGRNGNFYIFPFPVINMPKSKVKDKINKSSKKEEIDVEIASLIKKSKKSDIDVKDLNLEAEESELEEELESDLKNLEFHQFMRPADSSEIKAPVLERVALAAPAPVFVNTRSQTNRNSKEESDEIRYVSSSPEKNEPKYFESPKEIYKEPERINLNEVGRREDFSKVNRDAFFIQQREFRSESRVEERPWRPDNINMENVGREKEERKYKFKLPK